MAHIGIFDTGFGGHYVAAVLRQSRPKHTYVVVDDKQHMPYGSRTDREIFKLTDKAIQPLLNCDVIVIACNTATTSAITALRQKYPLALFVGFEPMIKPVALATRTGRVAILATPATLQSARYQKLKEQWANNCTVYEPDCATWAHEIENKTFDKTIAVQLASELAIQGVDAIALACTHYIYLKESMQSAVADRATIFDPLAAVTRQLDHLIQVALLP